MTIVLLTGQWLSSKGGPTNYVLNLAQCLRRAGNSVTVMAGEVGDGAIRYRARFLAREVDIFRTLSRLRPEIVHIHSHIHLIPAAVAYRAVAGKRCTIVFTFHSQPSFRRYLDDVSHGKASYPRRKGWAARWLLRLCDSVTAVSQSIVSDLNEYCHMGINRHTVISSGCGEVAPDPARLTVLRSDHRLQNLEPLLATIGVFAWDWKVAGHKVAIEAVGLLRSKYPNIGLIIAGDGAFRGYLVDFVNRLRLQSNIRFLGNVDRPHEVLAAAKLYVHMAMNEGSPLAVVEAMAAGKPIIAARRGGIPELILDGVSGLLIEPTPSRLADAVDRLLMDSELAGRLAENAAARARTTLTWESIAAKYISLYRHIEAPSNAAVAVPH